MELDATLNKELQQRCKRARDYLRTRYTPNTPKVAELAGFFRCLPPFFTKFCDGDTIRPMSITDVRTARTKLNDAIALEKNLERKMHLEEVAHILGLDDFLELREIAPTSIEFNEARRLLAIVLSHLVPGVPSHKRLLSTSRAALRKDLAHALSQIDGKQKLFKSRPLENHPGIQEFAARRDGYTHAFEAASQAITACARTYRCFAPPGTSVRGHLHVVTKEVGPEPAELLSIAYSIENESPERAAPIALNHKWYVVSRVAREIATMHDARQHTLVAADDYSSPPPDFLGPTVLAVAASAFRNRQASWVVSFDLIQLPDVRTPLGIDRLAVVTQDLRWATTLPDGALRPTPALVEALDHLHRAVSHIATLSDIPCLLKGVQELITAD